MHRTKAPSIYVTGAIIILSILFGLLLMKMMPKEPGFTPYTFAPSRARGDLASTPRVLPSPASLEHWKTSSSDTHDFSIQYPPELAVAAHEASSATERALSVDIGTPTYLKDLAVPTETDGVPLYLRLSVSLASEATSTDRLKPGTCGGDYHFAEYLDIDGATVARCEGLTLGNFPSFLMVFEGPGDAGSVYVAESMRFDGSDKSMIEQILSTLKFRR